MRADRIVIAAAFVALGLGCAPRGPTPAPSPSTSAARGPEVNWRGYTADNVPTEFWENYAPRPFTYEIDTLVDDVYAGAPLEPGVFFDGALLFTRDLALERVSAPLADPIELHGAKSDPLKTLHAISPDGKWLVGINRHGIALLRASATGVAEDVLFATDESRIESPVFTDDGAELFFGEHLRSADASGAERTTTRIHRFTIATRADEIVRETDGRAWILDASKDALIVTVRGALSPGAHGLERFDLSTRTTSPIDASEAALGAKQGELVALVDNGREAWIERRDASGAAIASSAKFASGMGLVVHRPTKRVGIQRTTADGRSGLAAFDMTSLAPLEVTVPDAVTLALESIAPGGGAWVLVAGYADRPNDLEVWDWKERKATKWYRPSRCSLEGVCEPIPPSAPPLEDAWRARDGTLHDLYVRTPAACVGSPCPIVLHLGERPGSLWSTHAEVFLQAGFVTIDADARPGVPTDAEDLAKHVRAASSGARPIGAYGYGGFGALVLDAMTRAPGTFDAGASIGATNVPGGPGTAKDPVLLLATGRDDAPIGDSFQLRRELDRKGVDVTLAMIRDEWIPELSTKGGYDKHLLTFFGRVLRARP